MSFDNTMATIEAILLCSHQAIPKEVIITHIEGLTEDGLAKALDNMNNFYVEHNLPYVIKCVANGLQLHVKPEFFNIIQKIKDHNKNTRLTKPAIEILTIIAYRQPITRVQIEEIRGLDCSYGLKLLLQRKLIRISGRSSGIGRPLVYTTSDEFLRYFGLNSIKDLPSEKEIIQDFDQPLQDLATIQTALDIDLHYHETEE